MEPNVGAFVLGCRASPTANPINARGVPTALALDPDTSLSIDYRFEARKPGAPRR